MKSHPLKKAMYVISGRWRAVLIYFLLDGPKRFSDLQRDLPSISRRMLTFDLKKLEEGGVVSRTVYPEVPARVEYQLTPSGMALSPIIHGLYSWGQCIKKEQAAAKTDPLISSSVE